MFVNATDARLGVEIQRNVGGEWISFVEEPVCECMSCDQICNGACDCAAPAPKLVKIAANTASERTWSGIVQVDGNGACSLTAGPACLSAENAPIDETFRAKLCYALSVPQAPSSVDAGVPFSGTLPEKEVVCATKEFAIRDGFVELGPAKGASCTQHSDCKGKDELCLDGECTTACPANNVKQLAGDWRVSVEPPDDNGFFAIDQSVPGTTTYTGSGTVSAVRYDNGVMKLTVTRPIPATSSVYTATVYVGAPSAYQVPFNQNETVSLKVIDRSTSKNFGQRAIVIRDSANHLLLAADVGQGSLVLEATDIAPFSIDTEGEILGCASTDCGKQLQLKMSFNGGAQPVVVNPGEAQPIVVGDQAYKLVNVANFRYGSESVCTQTKLTPYVIVNTRAQP